MLIVDDNAELLRTLRIGFAAYDFEVITATHGIDALMRFQAQNEDIDVILTDNEMPRMNGLGLIQKVRALGFKGRILVMSGNLSSEEARSYFDCEVTGFLNKPFEISMVATLLTQRD